jgi:hypothetical protein
MREQICERVPPFILRPGGTEMWIDATPIRRDWAGGPIEISEVLYEFDGPVIFTARIGLNTLLFAKRDETPDGEFFLAVDTDSTTLTALREGRISLRGALSRAEAWLIETDIGFAVRGFQTVPSSRLGLLLPARNAGLLAGFGTVPDTIEQAEAFIAFRFAGAEMTEEAVPLSTFKALVDQFSDFVRRTLTPVSLHTGRDNRFFDLLMYQPRFSSLVLAAKQPDFDVASIERSPRLRDVSPEALYQETQTQGKAFWQSISTLTEQIERTGTLSRDIINAEKEVLQNIVGLVPSEYNSLESVEITININRVHETIKIDRSTGHRISAAHDQSQSSGKTITGVITEVNGESGTFLLKDVAEKITTCDLDWELFQRLDEQGEIRRGRRLRISGDYYPRTRRGYLWTDREPTFLN